jgi:acetyl esterase
MMALDPKAKALLTAIAVAGDPAIDTIPLEIARQQVETGYARMKIPVKPVGSIENISIKVTGGEIPVRIYTPEGEGPFPVIVFFHGGGWVFFRLDAYDPICTHFCAATGYIVASVDYRLSPENKFPAALDDCFTATRWIAANCHEWNGISSRIFLAGDSAGGNLAAVTALQIRDEGGLSITGKTGKTRIQLSGQILIYPVTDYCEPDKPSYVAFAEGYSLTRNAMKWFWNQYLERDEDASNPQAAPLLTRDLAMLPPSLVIVSGYDPLRDEGIMYAKRLEEAGVPVKLTVYEDMIHGFLSYLGMFKQASAAVEEIAGWIKTV